MELIELNRSIREAFNKLPMDQKIDILLELNLMYDLTTNKGLNALKKEFKYIEPQIRGLMIEKGLKGSVQNVN